MGTRSDIIVSRADGKWARIYCHWDGYPDNNGKILQEHYNSQEQAEALVALGDLSSLGPEIGKKHDFEWRMSKEMRGNEKSIKFQQLDKMCNAYGRDRGEKDVDAKVFDTLQAAWPGSNTGTEYTYVWTTGKWFVGDPDKGTQTLELVTAVLAGEVTIHSNVKAFGGNFVIGKH